MNCNPVKNSEGYDALFALPDGPVLEHSLNSYDSETGNLSAWAGNSESYPNRERTVMYFEGRDQKGSTRTKRY